MQVRNAVRFETAAIAMMTVVAGLGESATAQQLNDRFFEDSRLTEFDFTGDCIVSADDIAIATLLQLERIGFRENDVDGDGEVTFFDTIRQIEAIVRASMRDPDGSESVDANDVLLTVNAFTGHASAIDSIQSDVDLDGAVTTADVMLILDAAIVPSGDMDYYLIARSLHRHLGRVADGVALGAYSQATANSREDCGGSFASDNWPRPLDEHTIATSELLPDDHQKHVSRIYPPNHLHAITQHWPEPDCDALIPYGIGDCEWEGDEELWPANHQASISSEWSDEAPNGTHSTHYSEVWPHVPNHVYEVSSTWPTDNDHLGRPRHDKGVSYRWPSNHSYDVSRSSVFPDDDSHHETISISYPATHNPTVSGSWPPSHGFSTSLTWGEHLLQNSIAWPGNHAFTTSQSWPDGVRPQWPPNHNGAVSGGGGGTELPTEVFPEDHTYVTSLRDILDLVP